MKVWFFEIIGEKTFAEGYVSAVDESSRDEILALQCEGLRSEDIATRQHVCGLIGDEDRSYVAPEITSDEHVYTVRGVMEVTGGRVDLVDLEASLENNRDDMIADEDFDFMVSGSPRSHITQTGMISEKRSYLTERAA